LVKNKEFLRDEPCFFVILWFLKRFRSLILQNGYQIPDLEKGTTDRNRKTILQK